MLEKRALGGTGLKVSCIGLGTTKFGRNTHVKYPHPFELPTDKELIELLAMAQDVGINVIDTAPAYGESEERIGKLLSHKQDWVIVTKVGEEYNGLLSTYLYTPSHIQYSIERSLKRLKKDCLDVVLVHSDGNDTHIIRHFEVFNTLDKLKQKGLIRHYGMSTKTVEGGILALQHSDIAMVTYHPNHTEEKPVIDYAHQHKKGILIKKGLASGHINTFSNHIDPIKQSLQFSLSEPSVSSIIIGTLNPSHLLQNVSAIQR